MKGEVILQAGHLVAYGAPLDQAIRITGARAVTVGQVSGTRAYQLEGAITERTAAAVYVISHHAVSHSQLPLAEFCRICRARGVPVIVDAASEYDLKGLLAAGADLAVYSGHKFLGGPTSGIVAGRKDIVRAAYLQNYGIGRGMKAGKESILGLMAALEAWDKRDHAGIRARENSYLDLWLQRLSGLRGVSVRRVPDPTENPLERLEISVNPKQAGTNAATLAAELARGSPPVMVRDHDVAEGRFYLDPCNLHPGEAAVVADRIIAALEALHGKPALDAADLQRQRFEALARWPD